MEQPHGGSRDSRSEVQDQAALQGQDLRFLTQRFTRLRGLSEPPGYWKALYQEVFEYDTPLFQFAPRVFKFVKPEKNLKDDPWKESFQQLQRGLHVRPGYSEKKIGYNVRNFDTVHDALNYAKCRKKSGPLGHDPLIFVHAGTHRGGIVIDFNVALLGASAGKVNTSVIIKGEKESTLKCVKGAETAFIGYICLTFSPKLLSTEETSTEETSTEETKSFCLEITSNNTKTPCIPTIHECIIENNYLETTAVLVSGEGANPVIKYCVITGIKSAGITVENFARGTYQHNKIISNHRQGTPCPTGIWVKTMASPVVRKTTVSGYIFGIKVSDEGSGVFQENRVVNNQSAAIEITNNANPLVLDNLLESGKTATVLIYNRGFGVFLDNEVNAHLAVGIDCSESSNPIIKLNRIHNSQIGVNISGNTRGWFQENNIFESSAEGICITGSNPIIFDNKIHNNGIGIRVTEEGGGHIVKNKMYCNSLTGVRIEKASTPVLQKNTISEGHIGVNIQDKSGGELEDNTVSSNKYNIKIESGSNSIIRKNKISCGKYGGVSITSKSLGFLEENEIFKNFTGVCISDLSESTLTCNTVFDNRGCGISFVNKAKGKLEENKILRNSQCGVHIGSQSTSTLRQNEIFYNQGSGIDITSDAAATIEYNNISYNRLSGISLATGVKPVLKGNIIKENKELAEKAVVDGKCLLTVMSDTSELLHDIFACKTCTNKTSNAAMCRVEVRINLCASCARTCHKDHAVSYVRREKFRCECGSVKVPNPCRLKGTGSCDTNLSAR